MTRINCSIQVISLTDEHLLAEHREIKRLPICTLKAISSGSINKGPNEFKLGSGHVLFFTKYGKYTLNRYKQIYNECIRRGFNVENYSANWECVPSTYMNDLQESQNIGNQLVERITERINSSNKTIFHYCGNKISKEDAIS